MTGATKHDSGKPMMGLLSSLWLVGVAQVLTFGAKKYASHNWRKGINQSRLMDAALRHLASFNGGEDLDPETGLSHLLHASCCIMFAYELLQTHPQMDDRYKPAHRIETPKQISYSKLDPNVWQFGCDAHGVTLGTDFPPHCQTCEQAEKENDWKAP